MELTPQQEDSLTELINIGYARAAGALSELTGQRISLEVPHVAIYRSGEVAARLGKVLQGDVAGVNQGFDGQLSGTAILILDKNAALLLNRLMTERPEAQELDGAGREVITEVGNILLNACVGMFGNLLGVQVTFTVPHLDVDGIQSVVGSMNIKENEPQYALMIHTRFYLRASDVSGYLVILLGVTSLERLLVELRRWEERQLA